MDLVNQYLRAVAALLPRAQRDDITAELRDIILSRMEARETALGRPLTGEEIEEELRAVGHPILVAARYREAPQHLVGPALYPYWMFAVKIAIAIQLAASLVALAVRMVATQDFGQALGHAIGQAVTGSITLIGVATVAAWLIERRKIPVAYLENWRVRDLQVLEYAGWDFTDLCNHFRQPPAPRGGDDARPRMRPRPYRHSPIGQGLFQVAFGTVFLLWWVGVIPVTIFARTADLDRLGIGHGTVGGMSLGDLHGMVFWPLLLFGAAVVAQGALTVMYPGAVRFRGLVRILMNLAVLIFCGWMWTASPVAPAIHIDSLADLVLKLKLAFHDRPPLALAPILTLLLGCLTFASAVDIVQGLWALLAPPWRDA